MTEVVAVKEPPQAQTVVTGETLREFQLGRMGMSEPKEEVTTNAEEKKPEEQAQDIQPDEAIPEDGTMEGGRVVFRGKWVDKKDVGYRMHLKTEAVKAKTEAYNNEKARADAFEARIKELEASQKKEEKPSDNAKPTPDQFTDLEKYAEAVEKWGREQALIEHNKKEAERKAKEHQEVVMAAWNKQLESARKELPDYDEVLNDSSVTTNDFSAEIQAAIVESEIGAKLLYHFAQNPEIVEKLKGMTLTGALREVGKIEAKLEKKAEKPEEKSATKVATKSNAPAPIKPVGTGAGGKSTDGFFDENGEFTGTPAEYRQLRREGKIK